MADTLGMTLLLAVVSLGLAHLAVRAHRTEFVVATAVVAAVGVSMVFTNPFGGSLLLLSAVGAAKLTMPAVPDGVPNDWR